MKKLLFILPVLFLACKQEVKRSQFLGKEGEVKLITLEPGHFHAALILKNTIPQFDKQVYVYAPKGSELSAHINLIDNYNQRADNPTSWNQIVYSEENYLDKMFSEKKGNVVLLAGNNLKKTGYINRAISSGFNVLSDKPMAINKEAFHTLEKAYTDAKQNKLLLYDMMTERYDATNAIQKELMNNQNLFGTLEKGTKENPAIESQSVHHFLKFVSGKPLIRPTWYYDVEQQGDGITDVTTHLIDLIMWKSFPLQAINYKTDVKVNDAARWATKITPEQFEISTGEKTYPSFLQKDIVDNTLNVFSNGYIQFEINGVQVKVDVVWNVQAPEGTGDTHRFVVKGTKANLLILQGEEQGYAPKLYVERKENISENDFRRSLDKAIADLQKHYVGVSAKEENDGLVLIDIPESLKEGHEAHFQKVVQNFLDYLVEGQLPEWEIANTLSKYYITTEALDIAKSKK